MTEAGEPTRDAEGTPPSGADDAKATDARDASEASAARDESAPTQQEPSAARPQPAGPNASFYLGINLAFWGFLALAWLVMRAMLARNFSQMLRPDEFRAPDRGVVLLCLLLAAAFALASVFDYATRCMDSPESE